MTGLTRSFGFNTGSGIASVFLCVNITSIHQCQNWKLNNENTGTHTQNPRVYQQWTWTAAEGGRVGWLCIFSNENDCNLFHNNIYALHNWTDWISESSTTPPRPSAALNSQCNHDRKSSLEIRKWTLWAAQYHNWVYERTGNDHETIANQMNYNCAAIFPLSSLLLVLHSSQRLFTRKKMQFWRESGNKIMINDWFLATCIQPTTHTHTLDWIKILK